MLILRNVDKLGGEWFSLRVRGEEIRLKIRPLPPSLYEDIRKKHKKVVNQINPQTRQREKHEIYDEDEIVKETVDFILEDFEGIGWSPNEPLEVNRETKMTVVQIPALDDEVSIADFVFEQARKMAAVSEEDFLQQEKK